MTNKHMVEEINRQIRGIAMNYPDGLHLIREQLDILTDRPAPPPAAAQTTPSPFPSPFREPAEPVKRGPGRPRKIQPDVA